MVDVLDVQAGLQEQSASLSRELKRLEGLQELRADGIRIAVDAARQISELIERKKDINVRDLNRSMEVMTRTAVMADQALKESDRAEAEATAPQRNVVLIILESKIDDERKRDLLLAMAEEIGPEGSQVVYQALTELAGEDRASELIAIEG